MYNTFIQISYENDDEYRKCLVNAFGMPDEKNVEQLMKPMKELYLLLRDVAQCAYLFQLAGNKILSLNEELGFTVLFSYSYFQDFHPLICFILENKDASEIDNNEYYQAILSRLTL